MCPSEIGNGIVLCSGVLDGIEGIDGGCIPLTTRWVGDNGAELVRVKLFPRLRVDMPIALSSASSITGV